MPECNLKLGELLKEVADNALKTLIAMKENACTSYNDIKNNIKGDLSQQPGALEILNDSFDSLVDSVSANIQNSFYNTSLGDGLPATGILITTILSAGNLGYLGLATFIFSLLKCELIRRRSVSLLLLSDLKNIIRLFNLMQHAGSFGKANKNLLLSAYKDISAATDSVSDALSQQNTLGYYSTNKLVSADNSLESAKIDMETPIADAIQDIIKNANIPGYFGAPGYSLKMMATPDKMFDYIKAYADDPQKAEKDWKAEQNKHASVQKSWDILLEGLHEYLGVETIGAEISSIILDVIKDITNYLPLAPSQAFILSSNMLSVGKNIFNNVANGGPTNSHLGTVLKDMSKHRTLSNLNNSIKKRVEFMCKYDEAWEGMDKVKKINNKALTKLYNDLSNLKEDLEQYVVVPGDSDGKPDKTLNSDIVMSAKLVMWKRKINIIKKYLHFINNNAGKVAEDIGDSYKKLQNLIEQLESLDTLYKSDNNYTPESEGAFLLINSLIPEFLGTFTGKTKIKNLINKINEACTSLNNSISADTSLISYIDSFTQSVVNIEGLKEEFLIIESLLNENNWAGKPLLGLIQEIRSGNLEMLINFSLGAATQIGTGAQALQALFDNETEFSPSLEASLKSLGLKTTLECLNSGISAATTNTMELVEASWEKLKTDTEENLEKLAEFFEKNMKLNSQINQINGVGPQPIISSDMAFYGSSIERAYRKRNLTSGGSLVDAL